MKRCYLCSRTLVLEGGDQNVSYLDSELCINCEIIMKKEKEKENGSSKKHRPRK